MKHGSSAATRLLLLEQVSNFLRAADEPKRGQLPRRKSGCVMHRRMWDPRYYQITVLSLLLAYGLVQLDFEVSFPRAVAMLTTALLTQYLCTRLWRLPAYDPRSALISGLSLCLLLRTNSAAVAVVAAVVTIASKFLLRFRGKHLFNPTNFGLAFMMLVTGAVWTSPGQWGNAALFAFLMACLGGLVVNRATRSDVTFAFLAVYGALVFGRSIWLGEPLGIPVHRLQSGALLLFSFFMISDPKTTPDSRAGRIIFATLVAFGAAYIQFRLFRTNGLIWSLAGCSVLVPLIDRLLPAGRYTWTSGIDRGCGALASCAAGVGPKRALISAAIAAVVLFRVQPLEAFCGFYVSKADTKLFNRASQVVLVRDGDRTVLTMANDFSGNPKEFAVVIPVPTRIEREQIHVGDKALIDHLDAYSAPRLVEYFDENPCVYQLLERSAAMPNARQAQVAQMRAARPAATLGVTIEAQYTVGEYDILILSATESTGLETWLRQNGYRIPTGAAPVLASYIRQNMRFFVAKVNLKEQARLGFSYLRPIQAAYESPKFMLPIRLGMINANGPQELFVYALTRRGRVETTNYRTVKLGTGTELPVFVKQEFPAFYKAMFSEQVRRENMRTVFVEHAWDMAWCDPCAADPLSRDELRSLGVFWLAGGPPPAPRRSGGIVPRPMPAPQNVFVTRLHVRYDNAHFPEDLVFQETADRENFQTRYLLRHAWDGSDSCSAVQPYRQQVRERQEREAQTLAALTGWSINEIRKKMGLGAPASADQPVKWWQGLWK
jgi:Na+-translocating ferredoxin:NAD+ oxidoreductase RnfD subunit